jgi:hypothetical protein
MLILSPFYALETLAAMKNPRSVLQAMESMRKELGRLRPGVPGGRKASMNWPARVSKGRSAAACLRLRQAGSKSCYRIVGSRLSKPGIKQHTREPSRVARPDAYFARAKAPTARVCRIGLSRVRAYEATPIADKVSGAFVAVAHVLADAAAINCSPVPHRAR